MAGLRDAPPSGKAPGYFSKLSPVPAFPDYTGPFKVGTVDVEIAVSELESPAPAPAKADNIHTVQFRVFYPAVDDADEQHITWLPTPQRSYVAGYAQFLGLGEKVAEVLS